MVPILRIINDIWLKASHAMRVSVVSATSPTALVDGDASNYLPGSSQPLTIDQSGNLRVMAVPEQPQWQEDLFELEYCEPDSMVNVDAPGSPWQ